MLALVKPKVVYGLRPNGVDLYLTVSVEQDWLPRPTEPVWVRLHKHDDIPGVRVKTVLGVTTYDTGIDTVAWAGTPDDVLTLSVGQGAGHTVASTLTDHSRWWSNQTVHVCRLQLHIAWAYDGEDYGDLLGAAAQTRPKRTPAGPTARPRLVGGWYGRPGGVFRPTRLGYRVSDLETV